MKILAFETSCDDTSIALFENENIVHMSTRSQIKIHNKTWGVVPEVASREHANSIFDVLDEIFDVSKISLWEIDYIAVTTHPWLIPSLLTWITVASTISQVLQIPIIPIDHIEAHIFSNWIERVESEIRFPLVCLTVSWWHNEIWYMKNMFLKEKLWQTQDDAAGEAYDKVAKMMWLSYPGGPVISKLANEYISEKENIIESKKNTQLFPRVFLEKSEFNFSFSGLKSAVRREIEKRKNASNTLTTLDLSDRQEISYEFQEAINEVLAYKIIQAAKFKQVSTILLAGWVSANDNLNEKIKKQSYMYWYNFFAPTKKIYCMDNAAMIGILAYYKIKYKNFNIKMWSVTIGEK